MPLITIGVGSSWLSSPVSLIVIGLFGFGVGMLIYHRATHYIQTKEEARSNVGCAPIVEGFIYGLYLISIIVIYGLTVRGISLCALGCILLAASTIDFTVRMIPNGLVIMGICVWGFVSIFYCSISQDISMCQFISGTGKLAPMPSIAESLFGGLAMSILLTMLAFAFKKLTGKQGIGGGDIKLVLVIGLFLGISPIISTLVIACILSIIQDIMKSLIHPLLDNSHTFPFAPALAISTWIILLSEALPTM